MTSGSLPPLAVDEWQERLSGIADELGGEPADVHKLMAHSPALMAAWWSFRNHCVNGASLGRRKGELVILRVAARMRCWYEWGNHVDRSLKAGIAKEDILATLEPLGNGHWPADEECLLGAIDELMRDRAIGKTTLTKLDRFFSNTQIMDLIAIHGMYLILAAMIETWELPLEADVLDRISRDTDEASFRTAALALGSG